MTANGKKCGQERPLKRLGWMTAAAGLLWLILVGRLVQVQAVEHRTYLAKAREQHERRLVVKAHRGRILDRRGRLLAIDVEATSFFANPAVVNEPGEVARHFAPLGGQDAVAMERQLRGDGHFVYLARQLDEAALAQAESRSFRGVFRHPETKRYYPQGRLGGQLLGYTDIDNKGSEGLEWAFEELLRATPGMALRKIDALGGWIPGSREEHRKPENGNSVLLTIDVVYQDILEQELERAIQDSEAECGKGVIVDPRTGEILAMANLPLYDPNEPGRTKARWRRNRTVTDPFEPGSTFKIVTMSSVIEEGLVRLDEQVFCENGRMSLENGDVIRDVHPYGTLTFPEVLAKSSNIGTIKISRRLPSSRFYSYIRQFGFAARTGVGLPAESPGLLKEIGKWSERSHETIAIGQEISVTALQLAQAVGVIANGGLLMEPKIVKGIVHRDGRFEELARPQAIRRVISSATAATMRKLLTGVVAEGTGKLARIEGIAVAGKTGTAQQARTDGRGYDPRKNAVSFVGFLPADDPELLCLVVVDNPRRGRWGGQIAAPAFKRIMERILYLPEGSGIALHQRPESSQVVPTAIPDLRGMTSRVARFQASLRGLPVTFSGEGEVVVEQTPAPGTSTGKLVQISCSMGSAGELAGIAVGDELRRQANLLQALNQNEAAPTAGNM